MISHQVLRGEELNQALPLLRSNLPSSVNAIDCIKRFPARTKAFIFRKSGKDMGISVCFSSGYNSHVWFDPVVWMFSNSECDGEIFNFFQNELGNKFVVHLFGSRIDETYFENKGEFKRYTELIMSAESSILDKPLEEDYHFLSLSARDSREVFTFLSDGLNATEDQAGQEQKFLSERKVYAVKSNDRIVSAGAIMSSYGGVTSIGAIKTDIRQRRKGLARYLISQLLKEVLRDQREVILFVRDDNYPAVELYRSLGFKEAGRSIFIDHGANVRP